MDSLAVSRREYVEDKEDLTQVLNAEIRIR